jgi:hypothetical protein
MSIEQNKGNKSTLDDESKWDASILDAEQEIRKMMRQIKRRRQPCESSN